MFGSAPIFNKISGDRGFTNVVKATPFSDPELNKDDASGNWRYDAKNGITDKDKLEGCELRGEILDDGAINGCAIAVDVDPSIMEVLGQEMNDFVLMRRPWKGKVPAGYAEPRWKIKFQWMSITIFTMVVTWEDLERLR